MKIAKFQDINISEDFINIIMNHKLNESDSNSDVDSILSKLSRDLKFNFKLVATFGAGVSAMIPIVNNLIRNQNLKIELTSETLALITIAAISIAYLEESDNKSGIPDIKCDCNSNKDCDKCNGNGHYSSFVTKRDAQTMLEELKMRGVGNQIIKKLVQCFTSIGVLISKLFKNTKVVISGLIDMLGYTSLLLPIMNGISSIVTKHNIDIDSFIGNMLSLGMGVGIFLVKHGYDYIAKNLKNYKIQTTISDGESNKNGDLIRENE